MNLNRREFLKGLVAIAAGALVAPELLPIKEKAIDYNHLLRRPVLDYASGQTIFYDPDTEKYTGGDFYTTFDGPKANYIAHCSEPTRGSFSENRVPLLIWLSTLILPPWVSMIFFTIDRPNPVPISSDSLALFAR